jgi:DNA-binding IclR family transcriptional regulator
MQAAETLGLHKSTTSRLLATLARERFLESDPQTGKYRLGLEAAILAASAEPNGNLRTLARPATEALSRITRETINLEMLQGDEQITLDLVPTPHEVRLVGWVGRRSPLHCTSTGKAMLAFMSPGERGQHLPGRLRRYTARTITRRDRLFKELDQSCRRGYAIAQEEFAEGLTGLAAPILDQSGKVLAALSVSGPSFRLTGKWLLNFAPRVVTAAASMSRLLGFSGDLNEGA